MGCLNIGSGFNGIVYGLKVLNDNKILVGGSFTTYKSLTQNKLIRLNSDGSKDTSFDIGSGFDNLVWTVEVQSDGKILVGGSFTTYKSLTQNKLIRLNSDGSKDTSFDIGSGFNGFAVYSIAIQTDGKILVGGYFTTYNGVSKNAIVRLNTDGSIDNSFVIGTGFIQAPTGTVQNITIQTDDKILVGGSFSQYNGTSQQNIVRINTDGSIDTSFVTGSFVSYGSGARILDIKIQSDDKILIGGTFSVYSGTTSGGMARLNVNGSLDPSFNVGDGFIGIGDNVTTISIQSDGKVIVGGFYTVYKTNPQPRLARLNTDASLDTSFVVGTGLAGTNEQMWDTGIQSNGKIIAVGGFTNYNGVTRNNIVQLNTNGSFCS